MTPHGPLQAEETWLRDLLEVSAIRYVAYYTLPFIVAWSTSASPLRLDLWFGIAFWIVFSFGVETANRLADRVEDAINQPERTAKCERIGFRRIERACVASWIVTAAIASTWVWWTHNALLAGVLVTGALAGLTYSYGLRTKRLRFGAAIVMTMPFCGAFLVGWATAHPGFEGIVALSRDPALGILGFAAVFSATLGPLKDITDGPGDAAVGYHSIWQSLIAFPTSRAACVALLAPYGVLAALIVFGLLPLRFLWLALGAPFALLLAAIAHRADDGRARHAVREVMYHYWFGILTAALLLYQPTATSLAAAVAAWLYWWSTTQAIHWSRGMTGERLGVLALLLYDWMAQGKDDRRDHDS